MTTEYIQWQNHIKQPLTQESLIALASHNPAEKNLDLKDKRLLSVAEFARYIGVGQTTARSILKNTRLGYRVKIKDKIMINRKLLDKFLDEKSF